MKDPHDHFSGHSAVYAQFRPHYPDALYEFIYSLVPAFGQAWDCGTGNGQVAVRLAERFNYVYANDISRQQLSEAPRKKNIAYTQSPAEKADIPENSIHLVTVAQALHWFDISAFYQKVQYVCLPGAIIAEWGYELMKISPEIDQLIDQFYRNIVGPYWPPERKHIENKYSTLPFPFKKIATPDFHIEVEWDLHHLTGYLNSWSSVQGYYKIQGKNPVKLIYEQLSELQAPHDIMKVVFPIFLRVGIVGE